MVTYIIEHLEPEMYDWCVLEYAHISKVVGKRNLIFTNVKKGAKKIGGLGEVYKKSVKQLSLKRACILDPAAKKLFTPAAAKKFDYFIFGGILGDNPQRFRTKNLLTSKLDFPSFNLGEKQMSTDTAVIVCQKIIGGKEFSKLQFVKEYEIEEEPGFYRILPFRYLVEKGRIVFTPGLRAFLKKQKPEL